MANTKLRVTELDFDEIKTNLKNFLKAQTQFKDYDFEGSGMSVLLDTLAYNTHYLGFNANMLANEMFIDSASLRSSVASHAKTLGYEINSCRAPKATINVTLTTTDSTKTMSAGTAFTTTVDGTTYQFVTTTDLTSSNSGSSVIFENTEIYEGTYLTTKYTVDSSDVEQRFLLVDNRADTTTLTVKVQNSSSDNTTVTYTRATDISQLTSTSAVYYLQEVETGKFEVYFGDGVVSKALTDGNIVVLQYVVTNKSLSNGASSFSNVSAIDGVTSVSVQTIGVASGGAEPETITSIKLNAPLDYASQGRAVTTEDYKVYIRKLFANTQAVSVWGGEDGSFDTSTGVSDTPEYGKVFISVKSTTGLNLSTTQKNQLVSDLRKFKVASVTPVIVDAETTFLILGVSFAYDSNSTTLTKGGLESLVNDAISSYNDTDLKNFDNPFRHSKLTGRIDSADTAILNNTATVTMAKFITPTLSTKESFIVNFANALFNPHSGHNADAGGIIASTGFFLGATTEYFFDDDGTGNLRIYSLVSGARVYFDSAAGTVDYTNGKVTINPLTITAISNVDGDSSVAIRITAIPNSNDVVPVRNQILEIDLTNTTVVGSVDQTTTTGTGYTTTVSSGGTTTTTTVSTPRSTPTSSGY
tara:strand:+ start:1225 stop:3150 length:1926 start_codon:yes stop_codon:yes gene_type:complete